jgi:CRP/FNR family transcriptional regulator, cyclic AMP receptor protein
MKTINIDKAVLDDLMKDIMIFQNFNDNELESLVKICKFYEYDVDEVIVSQDEVSTYFFAILEGLVDVRIKSEEGEYIAVSEVKSGDIFGEAAIFMDVKRTAQIVTKEKAKVARITRKDLIDFINEKPKAGVKMLAYIIFSLLHKLKRANRELVFEKESSITADDLDRLKKFFPKFSMDERTEK